MPMLERNHSNLWIKSLITACGVPPVLRKSNKAPSFNVWRPSCANKVFKSGFRLKFSFGHSAFGSGVTVTIVETSNVGVKVGMVGRGVMVMVDSLRGWRGVFDGNGAGAVFETEFVSLTEIVVLGKADTVCPHAVSNKIPPNNPIIIRLIAFLPIIAQCSIKS